MLTLGLESGIKSPGDLRIFFWAKIFRDIGLEESDCVKGQVRESAFTFHY